MTDSLLPPSPPEPYSPEFTGMVRTLKQLIEYMAWGDAYSAAHVETVRGALEIIERVRSDLTPARPIKGR